ncbi:elongation factor 1-gamma [Sigmodon hispidus]
MAAGTLYTYPENWRAFKTLIAAQYTTRTCGEVLQRQQLQVVQWVSFADSDIVPPASTWVFPTLGIMHHNKQAAENPKEEVRRILGLLDTHLKTRTFLVGERVTLADIIVVCTLLWLYEQVLEPSSRQTFPNTNRWFLTCINQPQFRAVLGEVQLCEKMAQSDAKKFAESQPKKDTPRKEKGSPEEKQKPQAERKEGKKAAAPAPEEEEMDECEQALAADPKAKDPFVHLPKSTFVLDEFKQRNSKFTQTFMSCNLITGMFQRLDKLRKNAFASVILFGTEEMEQQQLHFWCLGLPRPRACLPLSPDWQVDYESRTWRKLDPGSEETQTLVREYFSWEGAFQHVGKAVNQGKIFK